jgi:Raf kinase inhibitor-like YbhB/YbcL family protein
MSFTIASAAFSNGQPIPSKHTVDGPDVSPPLQWTSPPANTKALVLIGEDPDAFGRTWVHWVLYDIPPATTNLPEALPRGDVVLGSAKQGQTDFTGREPGYWGPALPPGYTHRYFFRLYAVDQLAGLPARATKAQVMEAIQGHVLARAEIMGTYRRIQR